jgi:hypothetical protein
MMALSLQLEGGAMIIANPIDDQYVLYHGNGLSSGVQMTSPVVGAALRMDGERFVLTGGWRDMGHQYIDTDIITDHEYLNCRYKGTCSERIERWYTRMSMSEFYASVGFKFHAGKYNIVPTVGLASEKLTTSVEMTFPIPAAHYHAGGIDYYGHKPFWFGSKVTHETQPFVGVDFEYKQWGFGAYYLQTAGLATNMCDPGIGEHAGLFRVTYRFQP